VNGPRKLSGRLYRRADDFYLLLEKFSRSANLFINNPYLTKKEEFIIIKNLLKSSKIRGIFLSKFSVNTHEGRGWKEGRYCVSRSGILLNNSAKEVEDVNSWTGEAVG
jgi:hypothetical protein